MTSKRLFEALDLCLECKGCKAECESGVDMAKLKYEFLDHYFQANGLPFRNRIFGHINRVNQWGSRFAPFSNWASQNPIGRFFAGLVLGIHPRRSLPSFAIETLPKWFDSRDRSPVSSPFGKGGLGGFMTVSCR